MILGTVFVVLSCVLCIGALRMSNRVETAVLGVVGVFGIVAGTVMLGRAEKALMTTPTQNSKRTAKKVIVEDEGVDS